MRLLGLTPLLSRIFGMTLKNITKIHINTFLMFKVIIYPSSSHSRLNNIVVFADLNIGEKMNWYHL